MAQFLIIKKATNEIVGYQSGGATIPPDTDERQHLEADDAMMALWRSTKTAMKVAAQGGAPQWSGTTIIRPADTRPYLRIESDKAEIAADGIDSTTVTVTVLNDDGTTKTGFDADRLFTTESGRVWKLSFTRGVATKVFRTKTSGTFDVVNTMDFRLEKPFMVTAFE